jgi:hypothetical protein
MDPFVWSKTTKVSATPDMEFLSRPRADLIEEWVKMATLVIRRANTKIGKAGEMARYPDGV